jgi:phospholipid/cholesterol/gamma-HCH transport system ATP-binding protein
MALIEVKNFHKSFGAKHVHRGVSFELQKGECLGLIGGSGSGKSVLLRSIIGLEKPDQGEIIFENRDITKLSESALIEVRRKIAYGFQGGALFDSMTVYENLAYPLRAHTTMSEDEIAKKIHFQLSEFGLAGNEKLFPANLSGGMQKRVGLARSIILGPEVILYDEPTAGLDPFNTKRIQETILQMKQKGTTSILVTHDMPVAFAVCDRIAILVSGKIESIGSIDEIEEKSNHLILRFVQGEVR